MINEGVYSDLSNEDYHAHKESYSRSALMDFAISPFTYWAKHHNPVRPSQEKTTGAALLGKAFHCLVLEPHLFHKEYIMKPEPVFLKHVGREAYDAYKNTLEQIERSSQTILNFDEWHTVMAMYDRFKFNLKAMTLLEQARIEHSFFWLDEHSQLMLKSRPDILHENMIVDLKTCSDASPRAFQSEMVKYGYHIQGAMIRDAVERLENNRINKVINICVETKYPYNMAIYIIDEYALDAGHAKYKQICLDLKQALEENNFRDYGVQEIGLPRWVI